MSDKAIIRKQGVNGVYCWDPKRKLSFGRIVGSFVWPKVKPGYCLILACERYEDEKLNAFHLHALAEFEDVDHLECFKWMNRMQDHYECERFYTDLGSTAMWNLVEQYNGGRKKLKLGPLRLEDAGAKDKERFRSALISVRTWMQPGAKLFHTHDCEVLKSQLQAAPVEVLDDPAAWPALLALSYIVESAAQPPSASTGRRQLYAVTDPALDSPSGYAEQ